MIQILLIIILLLLIGYIVARLIGATSIQYFSVMPGLLAIITVTILYSNYRKSQIDTVITRSTDKMIEIIDNFREDKNYECLWNEIVNTGQRIVSCVPTYERELMILKMLKIAENVNISSDLQGKSDDDNNMWMRTLTQWFSSPLVLATWTKYKYLFQDRTNSLFDSVIR